MMPSKQFFSNSLQSFFLWLGVEAQAVFDPLEFLISSLEPQIRDEKLKETIKRKEKKGSHL